MSLTDYFQLYRLAVLKVAHRSQGSRKFFQGTHMLKSYAFYSYSCTTVHQSFPEAILHVMTLLKWLME